MSDSPLTNCTLCQSSLITDAYDETIEISFCPKCDRAPQEDNRRDVLGGLLDAIKDKWPEWRVKKANEVDFQQFLDFNQLHINATLRNMNVCPNCRRPTKELGIIGMCLECENELRDII